MVDNTFTIRAKVTDNASPALKAIQARIAQLSKSNMTPLERNFREIDKSIIRFTNNLRETVQVFNRIAVTAAAVGLAFYGIGRATRAIANSVQDLGMLANRTGMATVQIQAFTHAAQQMRIAPEEATAALGAFNTKVELMRRNINHASEDLLKFGGADFVANLNNTQGTTNKLILTFRRMTAISKQNAEYGRMFAKEMFGSEVFARMTEERFMKAMGKFKELTQEQFEAATNYNFAWLNVGATISNLTRQTSTELMPGMTNVLNIIDGILKSGGDNPQVLKFLKDFNQLLLDIKLEDVLKGLTAFSEAMGRNIKDIKDMIEWIRALDDTFKMNDPRNEGKGTVDRAVRGGFLGLNDAIAGRQKQQLELQRQKQIGPAGMLAEGMSPISFGGFGGSSGQVQQLALGVKIGMLAAMTEFFARGANDNGGGGMMKAAFNPGGGEGRQRGGGGSFGNSQYPNAGSGSAASGAGGAVSGAGGGEYSYSNGVGEGGSSALAERRKAFAEELKNPAVRKKLAALTSLEGNPANVTESLANRLEYVNQGRAAKGLPPRTLDQMMSPAFYGPMRIPGKLQGAMANLARNPKRAAQIDAAIDSVVVGGRNRLKGATDQGLPTDPNGRWMGGRVTGPGIDQVYNDWGGGPGGHAGAARFRIDQQRAVAERASQEAAAKAAAPATSRIDNAIKAQTMAGSIDFNANITAPPGTTAGVKATGDMFRVSRMSRQRQQDEAPRTAVVPWDKAGGWQ